MLGSLLVKALRMGHLREITREFLFGKHAVEFLWLSLV